jgi:hypothetical protein
MIKIRNSEIRNQITEFSVKEFQETCDILQDPTEISEVNKWIRLMEYLGVSSEDISLVTTEELKELAKNFCKVEKIYDSFPEAIHLNGEKYNILINDTNIPVKVLMEIEKNMKITGRFDIGHAIAHIIKKDGISYQEHTSQEHIDMKMALIREQPIAELIGLSAKIAAFLTEKFALLVNDATKNVG